MLHFISDRSYCRFINNEVSNLFLLISFSFVFFCLDNKIKYDYSAYKDFQLSTFYGLGQRASKYKVNDSTVW